jgi:hypothetical protein
MALEDRVSSCWRSLNLHHHWPRERPLANSGAELSRSFVALLRIGSITVQTHTKIAHSHTSMASHMLTSRRWAILCRGEPYPITGVSLKLWKGGGDDTLHSKVVAPSPHGLAPTRFPASSVCRATKAKNSVAAKVT